MLDQKAINLSGNLPGNLSDAVFQKKTNSGIIENSYTEELMTYENFPEMFRLSERFGIRLPQIYISDSESPQAYAWPSIRITKGLIKILGPKEIFATILHEMGHRKTCWRYIDYIIIPGYLLLFCYLAGRLLFDFSLEGLILLLFLRIGVGFLICIIERNIELKVDSYVAGILKEKNGWLINAICRVDRSLSLNRAKPPLSDRVIYYLLFYPFKTHPSVGRRIRNIVTIT